MPALLGMACNEYAYYKAPEKVVDVTGHYLHIYENIHTSKTISYIYENFDTTMSRQQDVASRVEWLWRERLRGEEEGVETVQGINR